MTFVGFIGVLIGLLAWRFAFIDRSRTRIAVFLLVFGLHIATAVVYYFWVQTTSADTVLYYYDVYNFYGTGFGMGTMFTIYAVQALKESIGGTYLDYFLLFQAFGFWGIVFLMRTLEEIYAELQTPQPAYAYLLLFLPGIHFWSSAIGKDAPLFLASSICVWASMHIGRRWPMFAFAIVLMVLFRPYIALVALAALALTVVLDARVGKFIKIGLFGLAVGGLIFVLGTVQSTFNVDVTNAESVGDFFQRQSEMAEQDEGGSAVVGASFPVRVLSLLFRPFFIDSGGAFGLIASLENLVLLVVIFTILRRFRTAVSLFRSAFFVRFSILFALALIVLLSLVYYNVGLGLRQKIMFMPALLTLFAATLAVRRVRNQALVPSRV